MGWLRASLKHKKISGIEIFHRSSLARWICQTSLYKLAEYIIVNTVETNPVKRAVQYQVASVEKDVADVGQNAADFFSLTVTRFTLLTIQIELWMPPGSFLGNPFMTCIYETVYFV